MILMDFIILSVYRSRWINYKPIKTIYFKKKKIKETFIDHFSDSIVFFFYFYSPFVNENNKAIEKWNKENETIISYVYLLILINGLAKPLHFTHRHNTHTHTQLAKRMDR